MTPEQTVLVEGPESLASLCLHLRRMSDSQGDQIDADRLSRCADLLEAQAAELVEIRSKQTYRYIGKDGKMILARDLEDQRDALSAELATLRAERDAALDRVQHIKRGTTYTIIARGKLQTDTPLTDYAELVAYRCDETGDVWFRPESEFTPDRFRALKGGA